MKKTFPEGKSDLFAAFIQRCTCLAGPQGLSAMITMQSWMFLSSFEKLRRTMLRKQWIASMLHLGTRAFDSIGGEVVSSTAFVVENVPPSGRATASARRGSFVRIVDGKSEAEKITMLDRARHTREAEDGFHGASPEAFVVIPGSPIVYWLSEKMRRTFVEGQPLGEIAKLRQGLATADNNRFLREWWEVSIPRIAFACTSREDAAHSGARWFPYNKGGDFRKWYGNQEFIVNWENDGAEIRAFGTENGGRPRSRPQNTGTYFSPSVSWSKVSSGSPAFRYYPEGFITGHASGALFHQDPEIRGSLISFCNSQVAYEELAALAPTLNFEVGQVAELPFISHASQNTTWRIHRLVTTSQLDWNTAEGSWHFQSNPLVSLALKLPEGR